MPPSPDKNPGQPNGMSREAMKELWRYNLTNHKPSDKAIAKIEGVRGATKYLSDAIIDLVPPSRDQSLALTHLEEMLFHAVAGIVRADNEDIKVKDTTKE